MNYKEYQIYDKPPDWIKPIDPPHPRPHQPAFTPTSTATALTENTPPPVKLIIEDTPIINHDKQISA